MSCGLIYIFFSQEYYETVKRALAETPLNAPVPYKVRDMANKMALLDREVKYLINKAKIWKPKQEPAANTTESGADNKTKGSSDSGSKPPPKADSEKTEKSKSVPKSESEAGESQEKLELEGSDSAQEKEEVKKDKHQEL